MNTPSARGATLNDARHRARIRRPEYPEQAPKTSLQEQAEALRASLPILT